MKTIWQSKTFWLAAAQAVVGAVGIFASTYPSIGWLLLLKSFFDVLLRFLTTEPVTV
jgi:hypothetical protein